MAQTYPCSFCGNEPAVVMVSAIATGNTVNVGSDCMMMYGLTLAGVTPEIIDSVLNDIVDRLEAQTEAADSVREDVIVKRDRTPDPIESTDPGTTAPPRSAPPEDAAPPPPAAPQPAARRPRKTTSEPAQRRRTKAQLAKRPDSRKSSADTDE